VLNFDRDAVLIVDCPACVNPALADTGGRQCDGLREWTARFLSTPDPDHPGFNMLVPENENDLRCPECGEQGRVYAY
jgi:hypothetical protein